MSGAIVRPPVRGDVGKQIEQPALEVRRLLRKLLVEMTCEVRGRRRRIGVLRKHGKPGNEHSFFVLLGLDAEKDGFYQATRIDQLAIALLRAEELARIGVVREFMRRVRTRPA